MNALHKPIMLVEILIISGLILTACGSAATTVPVPSETAHTPQITSTPSVTESKVPPSTAPVEPTNTPTPQSEIDEIISNLDGLPIDQFFDASYSQLLLREPERLTEMSLSARFGLRDDQLDNLTDEYLRDTQRLEAAILELLRTYDHNSLTPDQQLSYDVYEWVLNDMVRGHEFAYHDYPLNYFISSYDFDLDSLLTELHPLDDQQGVEDYISRLSQVNNQVDQLLEGLTIREEMGIIPPDFIIEMTRGNLVNYLGMSSSNPESIEPRYVPVFYVFNEKLEKIEGLSLEEKMAFREAALIQVEESFIPGYLKLIEYLDHLKPLSNSDAGVWKLPNGDEYYAYMLHKETSTDLTPDEIHELGLNEVMRIKDEIRQVFIELGYPPDEDFGASLNRAIREGGVYDISTETGIQVYIAAVEEIIEQAEQRMDGVFDIGPRWGVEVVPGPMGGYYVPGAADGSRPGAYHVGVMGYNRYKYLEPTIAYHEAIPGHHYQIATAQALDLPIFRKEADVNGFIEGWALYAERLASELGMYDEDPYGNIGRLQLELLRAIRLVTDTGIHAKGWTREEARAYIDRAYGVPNAWSHEADRYIVMPAQATGYKIGMLKILELRQRAMDALGDDFNIKDFHNVVIGNGNLPLDILEQLVETYIAEKQVQ